MTGVQTCALPIFCLKPAIEMRSIIKIQLGILDSEEFGGKIVPELSVKDIDV